MDLIKPKFDWFDEDMCGNEIDIANNHKTLIGSTEYVFQ
jgi:hypothetical protein